MTGSKKFDFDAIFQFAVKLIIIMTAILIVCPILKNFSFLGLDGIVPLIQLYVGSVSIAASAVLLLLLLILTRHPHYDYFLVLSIAAIAGIVSVF